MNKIMILGAGKIGSAIIDIFSTSKDYDITIVDNSPEFLALIPDGKIKKLVLDVKDENALNQAMTGHHSILSALPFFLNPAVARAAKNAGCHYFDLTEDVATTKTVRQLSQGANTAFVPQCGLAPGFISIVAHHLTKKFDRLRDVRMRVGALPQFPVNGLKYNLTWSTDGLINEYCNPCEAIYEGNFTETIALEGLENFSLDGIDYEAFNTSGGLGTLCETLEGKVQSLDYKTVRYPGHRDIIKLLLDDLRLRDKRDLFKDILETSIPITHQDVVLIFVTVSGWQNNRLTQETYAKKIYAKEINGKLMSAIQITTAAGICALVDLYAQNKLLSKGFIKQEDVSLNDFLDNRFGKFYT
ncbi:MAG: saccharopine dehydrogenase NADP-binding domain-containing protein [Alphaproteobacteria bacterium]|nr:saccharopine dehydrogenase NADP-binding domain-containing protein [Alphaproteobacteria bacterium]